VGEDYLGGKKAKRAVLVAWVKGNEMCVSRGEGERKKVDTGS